MNGKVLITWSDDRPPVEMEVASEPFIVHGFWMFKYSDSSWEQISADLIRSVRYDNGQSE